MQIFSNSLPGSGSIEIGLQFLTEVRLPALGIGVTEAIAHSLGKMPVMSD